MTKSELVRKSLLAYMENHEEPNAWEVGQDLFGKHASVYLAEQLDIKQIATIDRDFSLYRIKW